MSGCPAGLEYDSDEDYDDDYQQEYFEPTVASYVQPDKSSIPKPSIFNRTNPVNMEELEQSVSLSSEDMRLSIVKEDISNVEKALNNGFGTETLMQSGWTALMYASDNASHEIVALLLERKASPNFQKDLFTPLMAVCNSSVRNEDKLEACAKLLIDAGARVNVHDRHVMTPLMYSAKLGYAKLVKLLCEAKAEVNVQDTQGWTALTFASANGFSHIVRVLLKYQADYNLTAFDGQKPADIAFSHGFAMLAEMLEKYDGDNLEEFQTLPDTSSKKSALATKYVKYGDLELFLYGLELGDLIPLMQEHHLEFTDLLKLTESEMVEIGITQLGVRKKLLQSIRDVHTNEWDMSALSKEQMTKLTTLEVSAIVANIAKHLQIINCSVKFVNKHLHTKKEELVSDNITLQKSLVDQCCEALSVTKALQADIQVLRSDAVSMFPNVNKKHVDLIEGTECETKNHLYKVFPVGILIALSCSLYISYKVINHKGG